MQLLARVLEILVLSATYPTDLAWLVIFQGFLFEGASSSPWGPDCRSINANQWIRII